jgi:hypothetical protein|tara:strand:- start:7357 stop:7506 length:150 start_codon:yes stop_codon:yes gene_type:complete
LEYGPRGEILPLLDLLQTVGTADWLGARLLPFLAFAAFALLDILPPQGQ